MLSPLVIVNSCPLNLVQFPLTLNSEYLSDIDFGIHCRLFWVLVDSAVPLLYIGLKSSAIILNISGIKGFDFQTIPLFPACFTNAFDSLAFLSRHVHELIFIRT